MMRWPWRKCRRLKSINATDVGLPPEAARTLVSWDEVLFAFSNGRQAKIEWLDDMFMPRLVDVRMWGDWDWIEPC